METARDIRDLVQRIHDSPGRLVLVTAGAGTQALAWLLGVAGASRTLLEALIPYDWASFNDFLGQEPAQYVAPETARLMAGRALTRGRWLHRQEPIVGLACTATIATDRPKRGPHRAHVATWQNGCVAGYSLFLEKGARDRAGEERMVSRLMLNALARTYGLDRPLEMALRPGDSLERTTADLDACARRLRAEEVGYFVVHEDGHATEEGGQPPLILAGAFNPLHEGHLGLARAAIGRQQRPLAFELSARNVDKPPLEPDAALERAAQFAGRWPVVVSNAPTFLEKSALYPGATFVVGYDTAARVLHPRYYDDSVDKMRDALSAIAGRGCAFLVAGRVDEADRFHAATDLDAPPEFAHLFRPLPDFREDISSTELRESGRRGSR